MNINQLHEILNSESADRTIQRKELITFLKSHVMSTEDEVSKRKDLAYDLASILSTDYARSLNDEETIDRVLTLAGELEVDYDVNAWRLLTSMIQEL